LFFFSSRRRHTRFSRDWSSDVCSSDLADNSTCSAFTNIDHRCQFCHLNMTVVVGQPIKPNTLYPRITWYAWIVQTDLFSGFRAKRYFTKDIQIFNRPGELTANGNVAWADDFSREFILNLNFNHTVIKMPCQIIIAYRSGHNRLVIYPKNDHNII